MKENRRKADIIINEKWCKGCEICVQFCPTKVLAMKGLKAFVRDADACILCMQCEMKCPDFAIEVFEREKSQANKNDKEEEEKKSESSG